ncbi:MAG: hypothetical protein Q4E22_05225 [Coriobacteriia bacterium]|nr:hypothetical protein [Coriobacteriia bacterium]
MKYTKEERLLIGRRIYEGEMTTAEAAEHYNINFYTARDYLRTYKASIKVSIPQKTNSNKPKPVNKSHALYEHMSKDELIDELIKAKIAEARAKKGYMVKGVGANQQFVPINKENLK